MGHKLRRNHKLDNNITLRKIVLYYLSKNWSPEQIAKRLIILYPNDMVMRISHETIYLYLYVLPRGTLKRKLASSLKQHQVHRRKPGSIQDYLSIKEYPKEVADRIILGHWEGDLIAGRCDASAIGTLVERTTRMVFLGRLKDKDAMTVRIAFAKEFCQLPKGLERTLTYGQGAEIAQHKFFSKETEVTVYFAHPHSPWERGINENTNYLIRQYFPKGTDFTRISKNRLKEVQDGLNDRPRKILSWQTLHEKFSELLS